MKVVFERKSLVECLATLRVSPKQTGVIALDVTSAEIQARTSDGTIYQAARILAGPDEAGTELMVDLSRLKKMVDAVNADKVIIETEDDANGVVSIGRSKYRLPLLDPRSFPRPAAFESEAGFTITDVDSFVSAVSMASKRTAIKSSEPYINVLLEPNGGEDGGAVAVGTTGKALIANTIPGLELKKKSLISIATADALVKTIAAREDGAPVTLETSDRAIRLSTSGMLVEAQLQEGSFPDYRPFLNTAPVIAGTIVGPVELLGDFFNRAAIARPDEPNVKFIGGPESLRLLVGHPDRPEYDESLPLIDIGAGCEINTPFKSHHNIWVLSELMKDLGDNDIVKMEFGASNQPVWVTSLTKPALRFVSTAFQMLED